MRNLITIKKQVLLVVILIFSFTNQFAGNSKSKSNSIFDFIKIENTELNILKNILLNHNPKPKKIDTINLKMPLNFAGEVLPVYIKKVNSKIQKKLNLDDYWTKSASVIWQRSKFYLPYIEQKLKEYDIPDDFKYLCAAESAFSNAVSPAKAAGYWQFMKFTAIKFGLKVNKNVDERFNFEKSTIAACKYLRFLYEKFGSWTLAAAAYNVGEGGLERRMKKQKESDYYKLRLPNETQNYVFRIVALKEILSNPEKYKLREIIKINNVEYKNLKIERSIRNMKKFAVLSKVSYSSLKKLNPWIKTNYLIVKSGHDYTLKVPVK